MSTTSFDSLLIFDVSFHKEMWLWLAEHPGKDGRDFSRAHNLFSKVLFHSETVYTCKYANAAWNMSDDDAPLCSACPLQFRRDLNKWGKIPCLGGVYLEWSNATSAVQSLEDNPNNPRTIEGLSLDSAKRLCRMYAKSIANMSVRNGVCCV